MSMPRSLLLCCALLFACIGSPAIAWEDENGDWLATRHAIYELEKLITFLEADPQTDDGYKAPIITKLAPRSGACRRRLARRNGDGRRRAAIAAGRSISAERRLAEAPGA